MEKHELKNLRPPSPDKHPSGSADGSFHVEEGQYCVQVTSVVSNSAGIWLHLANPAHMHARWGSNECWCLQGTSGVKPFFRLLTPSEAASVCLLNATPLAEIHEGCEEGTCISPTAPLPIYAAADEDSLKIGNIPDQSSIVYRRTITQEDGTWVELDTVTKQRFVDAHMIHLEAFVKQRDSETVFVLSKKEQLDIKAPTMYPHLQEIDVHILRCRAFLLEHISQHVLALLALTELRPDLFVNDNIVFGLGGSEKSLSALQNMLLPALKERMLKAVLQRTNLNNPRHPITLNRVQVKRLANGLAGPDGRNSVFAQAARELKHVSRNVFLAAARCWKVKFAGEGFVSCDAFFSFSTECM